MDKISVKKARVHNLKSVDIDIPRNKLVVITGPSGSGKSSLAFDTIYAEGQRRYIESLSAYARQFLGQMEPPDVESITGLSPAIAIDQKSTSKNPRSTVGTVTEIFDYMRVLYARVGSAYCPESAEALEAWSAQGIVEKISTYPLKSKIHLLAPVIVSRKGEHKELLSGYQAMGFIRARVNGKIILLDEVELSKNKKNTVEIVVDRFVLKAGAKTRMTDSVEQSLKLSGGSLIALIENEEVYFSENLYSPKSGKSYPELSPRLFSFNSPLGACKTCNGLGQSQVFDRSKYVLDETVSINDGAIGPLASQNSFLLQMVKSIAKTEKVDLSLPLKKLPKKFLKTLYEGSDKEYTYSFTSDSSSYKFKKAFIGIDAWLTRKYEDSNSENVRAKLEAFMEIEKCRSCDGKRLNPYASSVLVAGSDIMEVCDLAIDECYDFFKNVKFKGFKKVIADKLLKEITSRLKFLLNVGLDYLTLNRAANTLSGGESQRIRLATQIGSALSGVLYVLDEPSIGLHQRDNQRLIKTLVDLKNLGNTVLVVEHDEDTMMAADQLIDIGPGAGIHGGSIVAQGTPLQVSKAKGSLTGKFLSGRESIAVPEKRRELTSSFTITKVCKNNINKVDFTIPLGGLICVTGVSGSGKSTLIHKAVIPAVKTVIAKKVEHTTIYKSIKGAEELGSVIELDQSPIGRTPKSNPATYTKLFDEIRSLFAATPEAKMRGYKAGRFSFNVKGGRCEDCEGNGVKKIEMNFLPDVFITCSTCHRKRYNEETLSVLYKAKNIADILAMTVSEALDFFEHHTKIKRILSTLNKVGLGYIKLGQSSVTLSGGEAQRIKLSRELSKMPRGHCFYVLDEPTTGLHFNDIRLLLGALSDLVDKGHTVLVIEHNLDVIKSADHIIDLGPDGGKFGGKIVAEGTPEQVAKVKGSFTGKYLKKLL